MEPTKPGKIPLSNKRRLYQGPIMYNFHKKSICANACGGICAVTPSGASAVMMSKGIKLAQMCFLLFEFANNFFIKNS